MNESDQEITYYAFIEHLKPFIPYIRRWWSNADNLSVPDTGVYEINYDDEQPGPIYYRFTRGPGHSPIKGVQAFPFIEAGSLQLKNVKGGSTKFIQKLLCTPFDYEEFKLFEIHGLPSLLNQAQIIAFIPQERLDSLIPGKWVYLTRKELSDLLRRYVSDSIFEKAVLIG